VITGEPVALVETLAQRIADVALSHQRVQAVEVSVHKPEAPITVPFDDVVVTIHRERG
jgi:7,8-dihydroneopterin aldolase/epimerase/oxygenase